MAVVTWKQKQLLDFIKAYIAEHDGVSPTFDEMMRGTGVASKSNIHRMIVALEAQRRIRRRAGRVRTIEVVEEQTNPLLSLASARSDLADRIIAQARRKAVENRAGGSKFGWADLRPIIIRALAE